MHTHSATSIQKKKDRCFHANIVQGRIPIQTVNFTLWIYIYSKQNNNKKGNELKEEKETMKEMKTIYLGKYYFL